jgi:hypothetical protein
MPLREFVAEVTPFGLVKEIEGRLSLLIPDKVIKEQNLYENYAQTSARFTLVWWLDEEDEYDPEEALRTVIGQVTQAREDLILDITGPTRSFDTGTMMVTLTLKENGKEARVADGPVKTIVAPMGLELGENTYDIVSQDMGSTWDVVRNDEFVERGLPSVPSALGKLLKHLLEDLGNVEILDSGDSSKPDEVDKEFIESLCKWFANSPVVTDKALESLTEFIELITKRDFEPDE